MPQGIQELNSLSSEQFQVLLKRLGFIAGAFYKCSSYSMLKILSFGEVTFPTALRLPSNYTAKLVRDDGVSRSGWQEMSDLNLPSQIFPKGVYVYIPDHEFNDEKFMLFAIPEKWWGVSLGDLYGPFEAISHRVRTWQSHNKSRIDLNERGIKEHLKRLQIDLRVLLDHELRNPLVGVVGHIELLEQALRGNQDQQVQESLKVIQEQSYKVTEAVDRISQALYGESHQESPARAFDGLNALGRLCTLMQDRAGEFVGEERAQQIKVHFYSSVNHALPVSGDPSVFDWAMWELLKNAVQYTSSGKVTVSSTLEHGMLIIDIKDDGPGVSAGSEELVFMRFYQDESNQKFRKGKKGMGLGLFLARHMAERHLGSLIYTRENGVTVFRLIWPLNTDMPLGESA